MADTAYDDICVLYLNRVQLIKEWRQGLINAAYGLCTTVAKKLGAPEQYTDRVSGKTRRYIEVILLAHRGPPRDPSELLEQITDAGELPFGLCLTFDRGPEAYPKGEIHFSVAIRFSKQAPEFCFWSEELQQPFSDSRWSSNADDFATELIGKLKAYLGHDPRDGVEKKGQIGFIQD